MAAAPIWRWLICTGELVFRQACRPVPITAICSSGPPLRAGIDGHLTSTNPSFEATAVRFSAHRLPAPLQALATIICWRRRTLVVGHKTQSWDEYEGRTPYVAAARDVCSPDLGLVGGGNK